MLLRRLAAAGSSGRLLMEAEQGAVVEEVLDSHHQHDFQAADETAGTCHEADQ